MEIERAIRLYKEIAQDKNDDTAQDRATPIQKFSKEKFQKDKRHRRLIPKEHLDIIDGMEVVDQQIEYKVSGIKFYIYPVLPEWCEEEQDGD